MGDSSFLGAWEMDAYAIYESLLDRVSTAVMQQDFQTYFSCISLPYVIRTHGGVFVVEREETSREMLVSLSEGLRARGVTHYERICRWAEFRSPSHIEGGHFTHVLRNGERILPPYASSQSLIRSDGRWRVAESRYAVENTALPVTFPLPSDAADVPPAARDHRMPVMNPGLVDCAALI